jgi:hypothetical protein
MESALRTQLRTVLVAALLWGVFACVAAPFVAEIRTGAITSELKSVEDKEQVDRAMRIECILFWIGAAPVMACTGYAIWLLRRC